MDDQTGKEHPSQQEARIEELRVDSSESHATGQRAKFFNERLLFEVFVFHDQKPGDEEGCKHDNANHAHVVDRAKGLLPLWNTQVISLNHSSYKYFKRGLQARAYESIPDYLTLDGLQAFTALLKLSGDCVTQCYDN